MNTEEVTAPVAENAAVPEQAKEPTPRDYEAEARASGWVPEAEFKGSKRPPVFLDAEAFVKKGEEIEAFTRKENKALRKEIDDLKKTVDVRVTKLANVARANYDRDVANYEREIARLKAEQVKAVEAGDVPGFKRLDKEIGDMPIPEEVEADAVSNGAAPIDKDAIVQKFKEANTWYETDDAMTAYAEGYSQKLAADSGDKMPLDQNLKLVEKRMRELFPQSYKAKAAPTNGHASVDGGGDFNGVGGNPLFKLPNEARAQCKADMEKYPKIYKTAADWIQVYEKK